MKIALTTFLTLSCAAGLAGARLRGDNSTVVSPNGDRELQQACGLNKRIRITKFCINGDDDSGAYGEHQLRVAGEPYYPQSGFIDYREGQCHQLNAPTVVVDGAKSLTVGTEEHDTTSENDSTFAELNKDEWYSPQCDTYEVRFSVDFKQEKQRKVCWNLGASATGSNGGAEGTINAGIESCTEWVDPAESYIWLMEVSPDNGEGTCGGGSRGNGVCANGECCSRWGYCGTSAIHCGDGTCGGGDVGNGVCDDGRCCSPYGYCGTSQYFCGTGTCGGGSRGNGVCANGECCSRWGYCGTSIYSCT